MCVCLCIVVSNTCCVVFWFCFVCFRLVYPILLVSLDCPFLNALSIFSNVYRGILMCLTTATSRYYSVWLHFWWEIKVTIVLPFNMFTLRALLLPPWEFYYSHVHSSVSYNVFTLRVLLLPCSQFSVVQYVHPESFITPMFTVQCRTIRSPWELYYSHVHSSVSYNMFTLRVLLLLDSPFGVIGFLQHFPQYQLYHETMGKEHITNSHPCSQFSVVQYVHSESFITTMFTVLCRTICSPW
jgi:hypothetical protein